MTAPPVTLAAYTDAELVTFYNDCDPGTAQWRDLLEAEMNRRDAQSHAPARPVRRATADAADWHDAAHAQFLAAEAACNGYLVRGPCHDYREEQDAPGKCSDCGKLYRHPRHRGVDAFVLWSGSDEQARLHATDELRAFWDHSPRMTVTEYQRQAAAGRTAEREARHEAVVTDDTRQVRPQAAGSAGGHAPVDAVRAGSEQDRRPSRDAGHARATGSGGTGMIGHIIGEGMRAAAGTQRNTRGYGTTPQPAGREAMRSQLQARADEIRARAEAARDGAATPAALAGNDTSEALRPSQGAVALRSAGHIMRTQRERIDGAETLEYARRFLGHFAIWPSEAVLTTCTLWAAHTWARDASKSLVFLSTPRLLFSSAEPGSGKSHAMTLVSRLCPDPEVFTEPSEPAVAHSIGEHRTIALDEVDILFGNGNRKAAIRAVINDGYTPDGSWARVRNGSVHRISTFGPLMMAGLDKVDSGTSGTMAATLTRCLRVKMIKAPEDWIAPRFDRQARFAAKVIAERMGMFATQELERIAEYVPDMDGIGLREAQLWEPLLIMADMAGGDWPAMARDAADELITTGGMAAEQDDDKLDRLDGILAGWDTAEEVLA